MLGSKIKQVVIGASALAALFIVLPFAGIEPRTTFAKVLLDWTIAVILLSFVFCYLTGLGVYWCLVNVPEAKFRTVAGLLLMSFSGLATCFCLLLSFFVVLDAGDINTDVSVYRAADEPLHKIILQYYETGVTGNPNHRIIETWNVAAAFRRYHLVSLPDSISRRILIEPPSIHYAGRAYILESSGARSK